MKGSGMSTVLRTGRVAWYDASRGYGFVKDSETNAPIFVTHKELEEFGVTGLPKNLSIEFDVIKGIASEKIRSIIRLQANQKLH